MKKNFILTILISILLPFIKFTSNILNVIFYCLVVIILAISLGNLTSNMSIYIGEKKAGLIAATMGNIPELMMGLCSIKYSMIPMVKASLIGSILSNMLLGLGLAVFLGGIKYAEQKFNKIIARTNFNMLILAMSSIIIIASLNKYSKLKLNNHILTLISVKISLLLICIYILGLIFSFFTHSNLFLITNSENPNIKKHKNKEFISTIILLCFISILLYFISDKLIFNIKVIVENYSISQEFLGIILIPLLGNIGEGISSIICALDNKINMSIETAIGSTIQISMFVLPILMLFSCILSTPMILLFSIFQIIISVLAIGMSFLVFQDGKSYWFEGAILIAIYIIIAISYYYIQ